MVGQAARLGGFKEPLHERRGVEFRMIRAQAEAVAAELARGRKGVIETTQRVRKPEAPAGTGGLKQHQRLLSLPISEEDASERQIHPDFPRLRSFLDELECFAESFDRSCIGALTERNHA